MQKACHIVGLKPAEPFADVLAVLERGQQDVTLHPDRCLRHPCYDALGCHLGLLLDESPQVLTESRVPFIEDLWAFDARVKGRGSCKENVSGAAGGCEDEVRRWGRGVVAATALARSADAGDDADTAEQPGEKEDEPGQGQSVLERRLCSVQVRRTRFVRSDWRLHIGTPSTTL